jgi:glycosyltransferase involved in cell wall biosynthesis
VRNAAPDLIAIAIPLYGHAALVVEAIESVFASVTSRRLAVIVSVDGDPCREVFDQLALYAAARPDLHVIFGPNVGPGGARNRAIDYILEVLPEAKAVYFLDADNRVLPTTIDTLYQRLIDGKAGWIYTNIDTFSVKWRAHYGNSYSRLTHCIADNICDTGSMLSMEIFNNGITFRSGIRFDEDRQNGFEDWEFWLSCIEAGFTGAPCHDTAFDYRLRAESRFKEANRDRASSISFLRRRHKALFRRPKLVHFEHEECPRFALLRTGDNTICSFTDPTSAPAEMRFDDAIRDFWGSIGEPDNVHFPPFLAACSGETMQLLARSRLLPTLFFHLERLSEQANVVYLQLGNVAHERSIGHEVHPSGLQRTGHADLVFVATALVREVIENNALDWLASLATEKVWPTSATLLARFPFPKRLPRRSFVAPEQALVNFANAVATSPIRHSAAKRWTWRPAKLPPRSELYKVLRSELHASPVLPLGENASNKRTLALLVPIASFGGAEKVAFAAARELKKVGFETHLFVLGSDRMDVLDEFDASFDYIHLWKAGVPQWGSTDLFLGQDLITEAPGVDWQALKGLLSGFDLVINNHVMVAHPLMAKLRSEGTRTACYLHVVDETDVGRPAGQPFAAIAHEHCYDAFLTCSEQLKIYLHSFGVPLEKIFAVPNAPGFSIDAAMQADSVSRRSIERQDAPLRVLYMGRLDRQKGIDRLYGAIAELRERDVAAEVVVVGGEILSDSPTSWTERLRELGVELRPPVFGSSGLAGLLAWGDVLIMPSRWEGAPLMIAEAQQLGCVPVATAVGAVGELIVHGEDGLLIDQETDTQIVAHLVQAVVALARDPGRLRQLAEGCLQTAARRSWKGSFSPFLDWCEALVPPKPAPAEQPRQATVLSSATTGISPRPRAEPCAEPVHRLVPPS